jgi:putative FmdB family regulatory protein
MPIYEYVCMECDNHFEEIVLKQDETVSCPNCNSENTKRLMSACRAKIAGGDISINGSSSSSSGCAGCSGGNCSTCGR